MANDTCDMIIISYIFLVHKVDHIQMLTPSRYNRWKRPILLRGIKYIENKRRPRFIYIVQGNEIFLVLCNHALNISILLGIKLSIRKMLNLYMNSVPSKSKRLLHSFDHLFTDISIKIVADNGIDFI